MKKYFTLLFLIIASTTYSQTTEDDVKIYEKNELDKQPEFKGGMEKFYKYVAKSFNPPNLKNLKGIIVTEFVIEKNGSLTNIVVIHDIGHGTSEEIIKIIKKCPDWEPGIKDGNTVRSFYRFPLTISSAD